MISALRRQTYDLERCRDTPHICATVLLLLSLSLHSWPVGFSPRRHTGRYGLVGLGSSRVKQVTFFQKGRCVNKEVGKTQNLRTAHYTIEKYASTNRVRWYHFFCVIKMRDTPGSVIKTISFQKLNIPGGRLSN